MSTPLTHTKIESTARERKKWNFKAKIPFRMSRNFGSWICFICRCDTQYVLCTYALFHTRNASQKIYLDFYANAFRAHTEIEIYGNFVGWVLLFFFFHLFAFAHWMMECKWTDSFFFTMYSHFRNKVKASKCLHTFRRRATYIKSPMRNESKCKYTQKNLF